MNCRRNLILFLFLPVLLLWPWFSGFSVQAEAQYTIYESELLRLEQNLTVLENHSREAETIERASEAAGRSTAAIGNSQRTTAEIQRMERDDIELIRECQSILVKVRARGSKEDPN